jgi:glycosyltransferase involved in cell wall biosynthesis
MDTTRDTISVIVITRNEESNIVECLQSVSWVNEIVVVDSQSTDRTVELAKQCAQKIIVAEWQGYAAAKNTALEHATSEWILWLDADERVTHDLASEIQSIVCNSSELYDAYEVARRAYFIGKWIKHSGWYPGYVTRLFRKDHATFTSTRVHERIEINGSVGHLQNDLLHYTDTTIYHYLDKFNHYTTLAADDVKQNEKRFSVFDITLRPLYLFFKMYVLRLGFLDGKHGFVLALLSASYVFVKYAKVHESAVQ